MITVPEGEWRVGTAPIQSFGYIFCSAVAFLSPNLVGLAHILPPGLSESNEWATDDLEEMIVSFSSKPQAFIMSAHHADLLQSRVRKYANIVAEYKPQKWHEGDRVCTYSKDIKIMNGIITVFENGKKKEYSI